MAGLVPAIHVFVCADEHKTWMPGTRPGMTTTTDHFDAFDIVVAPFPTTDRLADKRRPAFVISSRKARAIRPDLGGHDHQRRQRALVVGG